MGLLTFWRAHPWGCGWAAAILGFLALMVVFAVVMHEQGRSRLRTVLAEQRAAGLGDGPQDYLVRCPSVDADLQIRAWQLFGLPSSSWTGWSDDINEHWRQVVPAGASWRPNIEDHGLIEAARLTAESLRALLRDDRLVLSIAGWVRQDIAAGVASGGYRFANFTTIRSLMVWLALAGACGDTEAEADLARLRRSISTAPSMIDLVVATRIQETLDQLRLHFALRGILGFEDACRVDEGEVGRPEHIAAAIATERLLYGASVAQDVLAGRAVRNPGVLVDDHLDPTGTLDWLRGAGDLATTLEIEAALERGEDRQAVPPNWLDLRSRFDPRSIVTNLRTAAYLDAKRLLQHRMMRCATVLAAAGRTGVPADEQAAKLLAGAAWPNDPDLHYRSTKSGFCLGHGPLVDIEPLMKTPHTPPFKLPGRAGARTDSTLTTITQVRITSTTVSVDLSAPSVP